MKFELKKTWHLLFYLVGGFIVISILAFLFIALMYRINDFCLFAWIIPNGAEGKIQTTTPTNSAETLRNFAWLFWMFLSLSGAGLGLWLAWRGRQIQQESHLQERYEKAANMLSSNLRATRVAACLSLADLGKADKSMKSRCVRLLFDFINDPPLNDNEKRINFSDDNYLRPDIQAAIDGFSTIYEHYGLKGVDNEIVKLPDYFWNNILKGSVSFIKANFKWECLEAVCLKEANLQGTNFEDVILCGAELQGANLQGANFHGVDLVDADISSADLRGAINLTKGDILSARWGYDYLYDYGKPKLPKEFIQDEDIKKWLETPAYDERKPKDSQ